MDYFILLFFNITLRRHSAVMIFSTNHQYIYFSLIVVMFFFLNIFLYYLIFKLSKMKRTLISFICFNLFFLILILYLRGFYFLLISYQDITPIRINNLSIFAQYKYLIYSVMIILFGILWGLSFYIKNLGNFLTMITFPYIKEEIRLLLYTCNNTILGPLCSYFYKGLFNSTQFSRIFFSIHFVLFYLLRFVLAVLFVNFTFFQGDLRLLLYMLPFSFISWFLSFFDFYFKYFREGTTNYILELLEVSYKGEITAADSTRNFITASINNFTFKLSEEAANQGFFENDLEYLKGVWYQSNIIDLKFDRYYSYFKFFGFSSFLLFFICWFQISYCFLFSFSEENIIYMSSFSHFFRRNPLMLNNIKFTRSPREIHYVREGRPMNNLKVATKGAVLPGHPVSGDTTPNDPSKLRVEAGLTHNPPKNTAFNAILLSDKGVPSDPRPIYAIPIPGGPVDVKKSHFHTITDDESKKFFEQPDVKQKMDDLSKNNNDDKEY